MKVREVTVTAVIPTAQYANIQASVTVDVEGDDVEAAKKEALRHVEQVSQQYAEAGKALPGLHQELATATTTSKRFVELASPVTGGAAFFDEEAHVYTNQFGHKFLSGSTFSESFCPPFDAEMIVPKMEAKYGVPGADIKAMWKAKADASRYVGNAIHKALELYGKYKGVSQATAGDYSKAIHDNPILRQAVAAFFAAGEGAHDKEEAMYEVFVVNGDAMICGHIDRLLITGPKRCRVQDFKTNSDLQKKGSPKMLSAPFTDIENTTINKYWLQLSFYAFILKLAGWTVEGLDIFHYDGGKWIVYQHDVVDITGAPILNQVKQQ